MSIENDVLPIMSSRILKEGNWKYVFKDKITEIRIRVGKPIFLRYGKKESILTTNSGEIFITQKSDINQIMNHITSYSLYAFDCELAEGFITIQGGHRIGICGNCVVKDGKIVNQCDITSFNIRIAHSVIGCAKEVIEYLFDKNQNVCNTLIFSPPGSGKTTLLRECVRLLSTGDECHFGKNIAVVDERMEIAAIHCGKPQNNLGNRTDIICGGKKTEVMPILLRTMAPDIIAVDEIGSREDFLQINDCAKCGVSVIATIHRDEILQLKDIMDAGVFKRFIGLKYRDFQYFATVYDYQMNRLWEGKICST